NSKNRDLKVANVAITKQRIRAEEREQAAIAAVKRFADTVSEDEVLKNNPALDGLRKALLREPLAFFRSLRDQLLADHDTRPNALMRLANAAHNYAHVTEDCGDLEDGLRSHIESMAIWKQLIASDRDNPEYQAALASIYRCRGNQLRQTGRLTEAQDSQE